METECCTTSSFPSLMEGDAKETYTKSNSNDYLDRLCAVLEQWRSSTIHDRTEQVYAVLNEWDSHLDVGDYSVTELNRLCDNVDEILVSVRSSLNDMSQKERKANHSVVFLGITLVDKVLDLLSPYQNKQVYLYSLRLMSSVLHEDRLLLILRFVHDIQHILPKRKKPNDLLQHLVQSFTHCGEAICFSMPIVAAALELEPSLTTLPLFVVGGIARVSSSLSSVHHLIVINSLL